MESEDQDRLVRAGAFAFLDQLSERTNNAIPRSALQSGFSFHGRRVPLIGPQGIFKPAVIPEIPLSITTAPPVPGRPRPYEDEIDDHGLLRYRYRGTNPNHHENVGLHRAMITQTPLIYLAGIEPGLYSAHWPAFITGADPASLTFAVALDDPQVLRPDLSPDLVDEARRAYVTRLVRQRLHQASFRARVVRAYRESCAVCSLRHRELLDAAHILPDTHERGQPRVSNGLAMCKLHHAAYDQRIVGIRPDLVVEIRRDVLDEIDGPMLLHGLQGFQGGRLGVLPRRRADQPDREALAERYEAFRAG